MRLIALGVASLALIACSTLNVFSSGDAYCRDQKAWLVPWFQENAHSEAARESPNGWINEPYSRENWNKYWNDRIYHVWDIGPTDCGGTYDGPSGPEIVRATIEYRQELGLPPIEFDDRNRDKAL